MTLNEANNLHYILTALRDNPPNSMHGICHYLDDLPDRQFEFLRDSLMPRWPEHSRNVHYPVPGYSDMCEYEAYKYAGADAMWNPEHPYGAARLRLLDFLIKQLEKIRGQY